jgi:hypothetical protein
MSNGDVIVSLRFVLNSISNHLIFFFPAAPAMTRADYTEEEVTEYFNYMGMLAEEVIIAYSTHS